MVFFNFISNVSGTQNVVSGESTGAQYQNSPIDELRKLLTQGGNITSGYVASTYVTSGTVAILSGQVVNSGFISTNYMISGASVTSGYIAGVYVTSGTLATLSGQVVNSGYVAGVYVTSGTVATISGKIVNSGYIATNYMLSGISISSGFAAGTYVTSGYVAQTYQGITTAVDDYDYFIYLDVNNGNKLTAKNGKTATVDFVAATTSPADATAAVTSAVSNLTSGRTHKELVVFEGYTLSGIILTKVNAPSYTTFDFKGAKITQASGTNDFLFWTSGATQVEFKNGIVDGNRANQAGGGASYDTWNTFQIFNSTHVTIHDMSIINSNGVAIRPNSSTDVAIYNNYFANANQTVIDTSGGSQILIMGNRFDPSDEGAINSVVTTDFQAIGNYIAGSQTTCINVNGLRTRISNNIVHSGATLAMSINSDTNVAGWDNSYSFVTDNYIDSTPNGGIIMGSVKAINNVVVRGNICKGVTTTTTFAPGIRLVGGTNCIIDGNQCFDWASTGIHVEGEATGFANANNIISNNICYNNGRFNGQSASRLNGITIIGDAPANCVGNLVQGNICYDSGGAVGTQSYGVYVSTTAGTTVANNSLSGNAAAPIFDSSNSGATYVNNAGFALENQFATVSGNSRTITATNSGAFAPAIWFSVQLSGGTVYKVPCFNS